MLQELDNYDWANAFVYAGEPDSYGSPDIRGALPTEKYNLAPFTREDVVEIIKSDAGGNGDMDWIIYGKLKDGRWFCLEAWCDYTGWDCRAGGTATIGNSKEEIERFGLTASARERFGITLEEI